MALSFLEAGSTMRIRVKKEKCAGHGRCAAVAPNVYVLDDDGYIANEAILVADYLATDVLRGLRACPERIISVEADAGFRPDAASQGDLK
jgi:ferredoxin